MEVKLKFLREVEKVYDVSVDIDWKDIEAWVKARWTIKHGGTIARELITYDDLLKNIWDGEEDKSDHEAKYPEVDWELDGSITFEKFLELEDTEEERGKYYFDNFLEQFISENDPELLFHDNCQNIDGGEEEGGLEVIKDAITLRAIRKEKAGG